MTTYLGRVVERDDEIKDCLGNKFVIKHILVCRSLGAEYTLSSMRNNGEKPEVFYGDGGDIIIAVPKEG
jgi:hypothetical protein